jgi:hypothetical protein
MLVNRYCYVLVLVFQAMWTGSPFLAESIVKR